VIVLAWPVTHAGDAQLSQGLEFAVLRNSVLVSILPNAQLGVGSVASVDLTVLVGVVLGDGSKAVGGGATSRQQGVVSEEFATRVDDAVATQVNDDDAVVGLDPAGSGLDAIGIVIKENRVASVNAGRFDAVVVQVQHQRVARSHPSHSRLEEIVDYYWC
jgi:hypothetical protein